LTQELANGHVKKDHGKKKKKKTSSFTLPDDIEGEEDSVRDTSAVQEPEPATAEGSDGEDADAALAAPLTNGSKKKGKKGKRAAFVLPEEAEAAAEDADAPQAADSTAPEAEPAATDGAVVDDAADAPQSAAAAVGDDADAPQPAGAPQEPADEPPVFGKKKKKKTADAASLFAALDLDNDGPAMNGSAGDVAPGEYLLFERSNLLLASDAEALVC